MRLVPYDIKKLKTQGYQRTKVFEVLTEFVESDLNCVKVEGWTHKTPSSCSNSFSAAIKRFNLTGVKCVVRNKQVYLTKPTAE